MMSQEQNDLITRTGPKDACGKLMRMYWQPAALVDELARRAALRAGQAARRKSGAVSGRSGPLRADGPRIARIAARISPSGVWRTAACAVPFMAGCSTSPGSAWKRRPNRRARRCAKASSSVPIPVVEKSGILWAYLGEGEPPAFPELDCFVAPDRHTFAFKGHINCNWLQALEVGIDPAHASFLHRFFEDEDTSAAYGRQFRGASAGSDMPMTKILREYDRPDHQCRAHRIWLAPDRAARDGRGAHACAGHKSALPARLRHPDEHGDDHHAVACAHR